MRVRLGIPFYYAKNFLHQLSISLLEKAKLRYVPVTGSHTRKGDMSVIFFQKTLFAVQCSESLHSKRKNEHVHAKKDRF